MERRIITITAPVGSGLLMLCGRLMTSQSTFFAHHPTVSAQADARFLNWQVPGCRASVFEDVTSGEVIFYCADHMLASKRHRDAMLKRAWGATTITFAISGSFNLKVDAMIRNFLKDLEQ